METGKDIRKFTVKPRRNGERIDTPAQPTIETDDEPIPVPNWPVRKKEEVEVEK